MMRQPWRMLLRVLLKTFLLLINFTICFGSLLFSEDIVISIMNSIVILIVFYQVHDISFRFEFQFFFSFDCFLCLFLLNVALFLIQPFDVFVIHMSILFDVFGRRGS